MNRRLSILLPWNTSFFMPLNGFHPLYNGLNLISHNIRFLVPKHNLSKKQFNNLLEANVYEKNPHIDLWWTRLMGKKYKKMFYKFYSAIEMNYVSQLPGDIEFLHTAPITAGYRKFIFHCESFVSIFMPFCFHGRPINGHILAKVRPAYLELFSQKCLSIISHNPQTLNELSSFFKSSKIDKLLINMDIGILTTNIKIRKKQEKTFLFLSSAHQKLDNFIFRGGIIAIKIAIQILQKDFGTKFIFRTKRVNDIIFQKHGIDTHLLHIFEEQGKIIWLENRLLSNQMEKLYAKADFLLLPSASLHTVSILSAMQYKVIPIVTDIPGYEIFLNDQSAIILRGLKENICKSKMIADANVLIDDYSAFFCTQDLLVLQAIEKILCLLKNQDELEKIKKNVYKIYIDRFSAERFISNFEKHIKSISSDDFKKTNNISPFGEEYIEDLTDSWFETCPQPISLAFLGHGSFRKIFKQYLYTISSFEDIMQHRFEDFSFLKILFRSHMNGGDCIIKDCSVGIFQSKYMNEGGCIVKGRSVRLFGPMLRPRRFLYSFIRFVSNKLRSYPMLFAFAKKVYNAVFFRKQYI